MNPHAQFLSALGALVLVGCATDSPPVTQSATRPKLYEWYDDGGGGALEIHINLSSQRAYFMRGRRKVGWSYVATGRPGNSTPEGSFRVTEKVLDKHSNRYGWIENEFGEKIDHDASQGDPVPPGGRYVPAPMPYWMRLTGYGIGMHAGFIPQPGQPASHGCIRLPKPLAPKLYHAVVVGTPVIIEYGPSVPYEVHPPPQRFANIKKDNDESPKYERDSDGVLRRNGLRVVSSDDPWIVWPDELSRTQNGNR